MNNAPNPSLWSRGSPRIVPLDFRRAPLLAAAVCFALGELMSNGWRPAVLLLVALFFLFGLTLLALRGWLRVAVVPLCGIWMAMGMWSADLHPAPQQQARLIQDADGLSRTVRGSIMRVRMLPPRPLRNRLAADQAVPGQDIDPTEWHEPEPPAAMSIDLQIDHVEELTPEVSSMVPISGGVRVTVLSHGNALPDLRCGDRVVVPMQMHVPQRYRNPGAWQYADFLLTEGIGVHANVLAAKVVKTGATRSTFQCRMYAAQSWAASRMDGLVHSPAERKLPNLLRLSSDDAAMLKAMLFGDRASLTQPQRIGFQRTGSFHLFVVSGLHVTLLAGAVFWVARRLRVREWLATLLTLSLATAYALLTGFGAPVQRALCMTGLFLVARLLSRERSVLNGIGAAALGALVWSPHSLFESSFQMTFLAVIAIGGIAVPLGERSLVPYARAAHRLHNLQIDHTLSPGLGQFRLMLRVWAEALAQAFGRWAYWVPGTAVRAALWLAELSLLGLVVEMVMVLPMAVYFHRATPFALPANMLSIPMIAVLAPLGVMTFLASLLSPWLAILPGSVTSLLLHAITSIVAGISRVRIADVRVPMPVWWVMVIAVVGWAVCCWAVRRPAGGWAWASIAVLPAVAVLVLWPEPAVVSPGLLEVTAIDVGQGDSLLVVSPDGATLLVDAGGPVGSIKETSESQVAFDVGEDVVSPYLWSRRIRRLDVVALSHAHSDHMGGMIAVLRNFKPHELWVGNDANSEAYRALLTEAATLGVVVRHFHADDALEWSHLDVKFLSPEFEYNNPADPKNDDSLVIRIDYSKSSVLLEGDAEAPSERAMLRGGRLTPVTLLKVGHHGSRTSTIPEFFAAIAPRDAVVSVGRGNTFGHPRFEVIQRIAAAHTRLYRTDEFGLTTFLLDRDGKIRESFPLPASQ